MLRHFSNLVGHFEWRNRHTDDQVQVPHILKTNIWRVFNSLWFSDVIWRRRSGSALARVRARCLMTPSHYLHQCWLLISKVPWHSPERNLTECPHYYSVQRVWKLYFWNYYHIFHGGSELCISVFLSVIYAHCIRILQLVLINMYVKEVIEPDTINWPWTRTWDLVSCTHRLIKAMSSNGYIENDSFERWSVVNSLRWRVFTGMTIDRNGHLNISQPMMTL